MRHITVDVIEVNPLRQIAPNRRVTHARDFAPADVRQLLTPGIESTHLARKQPQAGRAAVLLGALEEQLHAHAAAEQRHARLRALAQQRIEAQALDHLHRGRESAHAGQEQAVGALELRRLPGDERVRTDALQRLFDRAAVTHAVIDYGDAGPYAHAVRVPLVLGTPVSVGSIATACRSALASALNAASIMWWALLPACTCT